MRVNTMTDCPRCHARKWVAASLSGPVSHGGRRIWQCVPCGYFVTDEDHDETAHPAGGAA